MPKQKQKAILTQADIDILSKVFATKADSEDIKSDLITIKSTVKSLQNSVGTLENSIIKIIVSQQDLKDQVESVKEDLSHQIGNFKSEIIDEYKRVDDNQIGLQGRVFDHEDRIENLEKITHTVVQQ